MNIKKEIKEWVEAFFQALMILVVIIFMPIFIFYNIKKEGIYKGDLKYIIGCFVWWICFISMFLTPIIIKVCKN